MIGVVAAIDKFVPLEEAYDHIDVFEELEHAARAVFSIEPRLVMPCVSYSSQTRRIKSLEITALLPFRLAVVAGTKCMMDKRRSEAHDPLE